MTQNYGMIVYHDSFMEKRDHQNSWKRKSAIKQKIDYKPDGTPPWLQSFGRSFENENLT